MELSEITSLTGKRYIAHIQKAFTRINGDAADAPTYTGWLVEAASGRVIGSLAEGDSRADVYAQLAGRVRRQGGRR